MRKNICQFIKFSIVGIGNTGIYLIVYYLCVWLKPDWYMIGSILGTALSISNAFIWNDRFVFAGRQNDMRSKLKRYAKTYICYSGTSFFSNVLLWLEVTVLNISRNIAPIINLIITIPLNFIINKFWTFKVD